LPPAKKDEGPYFLFLSETRGEPLGGELGKNATLSSHFLPKKEEDCSLLLQKHRSGARGKERGRGVGFPDS